MDGLGIYLYFKKVTFSLLDSGESRKCHKAKYSKWREPSHVSPACHLASPLSTASPALLHYSTPSPSCTPRCIHPRPCPAHMACPCTVHLLTSALHCVLSPPTTLAPYPCTVHPTLLAMAAMLIYICLLVSWSLWYEGLGLRRHLCIFSAVSQSWSCLWCLVYEVIDSCTRVYIITINMAKKVEVFSRRQRRKSKAPQRIPDEQSINLGWGAPKFPLRWTRQVS